jgi:hypothetical protein
MVVPVPELSVPLALVDPPSVAVMLAPAVVTWVTELPFPQLALARPSSPLAQDVTTIMTIDAAVVYPRMDRVFMAMNLNHRSHESRRNRDLISARGAHSGAAQEALR